MRRADLVSDCGKCAAMCCVATSFDASDDFACAKAAGEACRHLQADHRCAIHPLLAARGFAGCAVYDCYGAGPRATRAFSERERAEAFLLLRDVLELLWLASGAAELCPPAQSDVRAELERLAAELELAANAPLARLREVDLVLLHERTHRALRRLGAALGGRRALAVLR